MATNQSVTGFRWISLPRTGEPLEPLCGQSCKNRELAYVARPSAASLAEGSLSFAYATRRSPHGSSVTLTAPESWHDELNRIARELHHAAYLGRRFM
jgi:hypothetical protein